MFIRILALLLDGAVSLGSGRAARLGGHGKEPAFYFCSFLPVLALPSPPTALTLVLTLSLQNKVIYRDVFSPPCCYPRANPMLSPPPEILGANEQLILTSLHRQCNNPCSPAHSQG